MARPSVQQSYPSVTRGNSRRASVALPAIAPARNERQSGVEKTRPTPVFDRLTSVRLKRGHTVSYVGLFVFMLALYARSSDFYQAYYLRSCLDRLRD